MLDNNQPAARITAGDVLLFHVFLDFILITVLLYMLYMYAATQ